MKNQPVEVIIAYFSTAVFWILIVTAVFVLGRFNSKALRFKEKMLPNQGPALWIGLLYFGGAFIAKGWTLNSLSSAIGAVGVFCQSWLGLTIARSIADFEPLQVVKSFEEHHRPLRKAITMLLMALVFVLPALIIGTIGLSICRSLFGEVYNPADAVHALPPNKWLMFFAFFSGAGIAEETTYRLVLMSLFWKLFKRPWPAIVSSAVLFGLYHLSPLDAMYRTFWQYPISQFTSSCLIGIVWGYLYKKRGYETAVLAHTFSDWLPMLIFMK